MRIVRSRIGRLSAAVGIVCLSSLAVAQEPPAVPPTQSPGASHPNAPAAATPPTNDAPSADAAFEASIERRAGETVDEMKLDDAAKADRVKARFKQHFRDLQAWDVAHGKERSELFNALRKDKENAELQAKYDALVAPLLATQKAFFADIEPQLTPEQLELVKERLVSGRYNHKVKGFALEYPNLPPEVWQEVVAMWQKARDEAMPLGNSRAKDQIFDIYQGRVTNYLAKGGYVGVRAAAKKAKAASQPAAAD